MPPVIYLKIAGRVQGVNLRYRAQRRAQQENLGGWIQNEPDGTVTCCLQGSAAGIDGFIDWLKRNFEIQSLEKSTAESAEQFNNFIVKC